VNCDRCGRKMDKPAAKVGKYQYGPVCFEKMFGKKEPAKRKKRTTASRVEIDQLDMFDEQ